MEEGEGEPPPGPSTSRPSLSRHCTVYLLTAFTSVSPTLALAADTSAPFRASLSPSRGLASPAPAACTLKARSGSRGRAEPLGAGAGALWGEKLWARCTPVFLPADTRTALMMSECCGSDSFLKVRRVVTGGGAASAGGSVAGDTARHKGVNGSHEQLGINEL